MKFYFDHKTSRISGRLFINFIVRNLLQRKYVFMMEMFKKKKTEKQGRHM